MKFIQIVNSKWGNRKTFGRNHSGCPFESGPKIQLTVLVNKHAERDAVGIEPIQKILDVTANEWIKPKFLLVFNHSLCHCRNHIIVSISDFNQNLQKAVWEGNKKWSVFISHALMHKLPSCLQTIYVLVFL